MKNIQKVTLEDLKSATKNSSEPRTHPTVTVTLPISAAACPTTDCASITKPCNK